MVKTTRSPGTFGLPGLLVNEFELTYSTSACATIGSRLNPTMRLPQ